MEDTKYMRQLGLIDMDKVQKSRIIVIGAGAVGSYTVLGLAKLGVPYIQVFDMDTVEEHNVSNQLYGPGDIGKPKVDALAEWIDKFTGIEIEAINEAYEDQPLKGIVITPLDSMDARTKVWEANKDNPLIPLYIDPRMGAEVAQIYSFRPIHEGDKYEKTLYPDEETTQEPCTSRSINYTPQGMASLICCQFKKWIGGDFSPGLICQDFKLPALHHLQI